MTDIAIRVENLSKRYPSTLLRTGRIGLREEMHDTLAGALTDFVTRPIRNLRRLRRLTRFDDNGSTFKRSNVQRSNGEDIIWALKDVSFEACPEPRVELVETWSKGEARRSGGHPFDRRSQDRHWPQRGGKDDAHFDKLSARLKILFPVLPSSCKPESRLGRS